MSFQIDFPFLPRSWFPAPQRLIIRTAYVCFTAILGCVLPFFGSIVSGWNATHAWIAAAAVLQAASGRSGWRQGECLGTKAAVQPSPSLPPFLFLLLQVGLVGALTYWPLSMYFPAR